MERVEPYYAEDTDGVHFQVLLGAPLVRAYAGRDLLLKRYGPPAPGNDWVTVYLRHRREIDRCAERIAGRQEQDTVILRLHDLQEQGD